MASALTAAAVIFVVLAGWVAVERMAGSQAAERPGDCSVPEDSGRCHQCSLEAACPSGEVEGQHEG